MNICVAISRNKILCLMPQFGVLFLMSLASGCSHLVLDNELPLLCVKLIRKLKILKGIKEMRNSSHKNLVWRVLVEREKECGGQERNGK